MDEQNEKNCRIDRQIIGPKLANGIVRLHDRPHNLGDRNGTSSAARPIEGGRKKKQGKNNMKLANW